MANYLVTDTDLHSVATAITSKAGIPENPLLFPSGFISAIQSISGGLDGWEDASDNFEPSSEDIEILYALRQTNVQNPLYVVIGFIYSEQWELVCTDYSEFGSMIIFANDDSLVDYLQNESGIFSVSQIDPSYVPCSFCILMHGSSE